MPETNHSVNPTVLLLVALAGLLPFSHYYDFRQPLEQGIFQVAKQWGPHISNFKSKLSVMWSA